VGERLDRGYGWRKAVRRGPEQDLGALGLPKIDHVVEVPRMVCLRDDLGAAFLDGPHLHATSDAFHAVFDRVA